MARPGVTYHEVAQAATQLHEQNTRPSIEGVRRILGTGSNSTINRHLREWREKQGTQLEIKQGLPETLLIAVKGLYEAMKDDADKMVATNKAEADQAVRDIQHILTNQERTNRELLQKLKALETELQTEIAEKQALSTQSQSLQRQLEKRTDEVELLKQRLQDKDDNTEQLTTQLRHAQSNLEHFRESTRLQREEELTRHQSHISQLDTEIRALNSRSSNQQAEIARLTTQHQTLEQTNITQSEQIKTLEGKLATTTNKAYESQSQLNLLKDQHDLLKDEKATLAQSHQNNIDELHSLKFQLERIKGEQVGSARALKKAEDTIANISNKNLFLVQENAELKTALKHKTFAKQQD